MLNNPLFYVGIIFFLLAVSTCFSNLLQLDDDLVAAVEESPLQYVPPIASTNTADEGASFQNRTISLLIWREDREGHVAENFSLTRQGFRGVLSVQHLEGRITALALNGMQFTRMPEKGSVYYDALTAIIGIVQELKIPA